MYKLLKDLKGAVNQVFDTNKNAIIPFDPDNSDYQIYLKWLAEGGVPIPADENA